ARRGAGGVGPADQHLRGRRARLGARRERPPRPGAEVCEPRARPGHAQRAAVLPPRHDRARAGPDHSRPAGPPRGPRDQPVLLDAVVGRRGADAPPAGELAMRRFRHVAAISVLVVGMSTALSIAAAGPASAHPLGNFTINRYSGLDLRPGRVSVLYVLDMAEIPTYEQMADIDANGNGTASAAERQAWADRTAPAILSRVALAVDGVPVPLHRAADAMVFRAGQ